MGSLGSWGWRSLVQTHVPVLVQVGSLLGGTLGFGVKKADIPDLQRHLLDLDPYDDDLTEEFWETVC